VPNMGKSISEGLRLGQQFMEAPVKRRAMQQQEKMRNMQMEALTQEQKDKEALRLFASTGGQPVTMESYIETVELLKERGFPIDEDDMEANAMNVAGLNKDIQMGANLYKQQQALTGGGRSAIKGVEGDITFRDEEGNIFSQQTFLDPNTQQTKAVLTDVSGRGVEPVGKLNPVSTMGQTIADETKSAAERAAAIAGAKSLAEYAAKLEKEPELAARLEAAKNYAKTQADEGSLLDRMEANLPTIMDTVETLEGLADTATYTGVGRVFNGLVKELGLPQPRGADARAEYIATVRNALLPLLRATFGSAFTEKEGDKLLETLGDVNSTPSQKKSELRAFVVNKEREIRTQKRVVNRAERRVGGAIGEVDDIDSEILMLEAETGMGQ